MTGNKIGNYTIVRELQKGGMSTIFLAVHQELNRQVALKVMHPDLSQDAEFVKRFEQEARIIAKLEHTNILQVYDFGKSGAAYFIAMEYVDGLDLEKLLKQNGPIPWEIAGILFHQISLALVEAHTRQILHRDIKLQNILIKANGIAKLADFGISKDFEMKSITRTRDLIGTPYYMAPELIRGKPSSLQVDIYSFGVCMYYALTGSPPFEGPNIAAVFDRIVDASPPLLSAFGIYAPKEITDILDRCMAKEPADRYAGAALLSADLARCLYRNRVINDKQEVERYLKEPHAYLLEQRGKRIAARQEEAEALLLEGKVFEALNAYKGVLALDPDNEAVENKILELSRDLPVNEGTHILPEFFPAKRKTKFRLPALLFSVIIVLLFAGVLIYLSGIRTEDKAAVPIVPVSAFLEKARVDTAPMKEPPMPIKAAPALERHAVRAAPPVRAETLKTTAAALPDTQKIVPCTGTLAIYSAIWADVFLDGKKWGRSPTKEAISVPCGDHAVRLESIDGRQYNGKIKVEQDLQAHLKIEKSEFK